MTSDIVSLEIAEAIGCGLPLIPVLLNDARMPHETSLPLSIAPMGRRQAVSITNRDFNTSMQSLFGALTDLLGIEPSSPKPIERARGRMELLAKGTAVPEPYGSLRASSFFR